MPADATTRHSALAITRLCNPVVQEFPAPAARNKPMSMTTILIIVLIIVLLGGGGFYMRGRR
ncbi:MAG: hypothetical protein H7Y17_16065 [Chlorobia bacterium]|nr:hypothetical protein [Fimbriimonadaceae bacterium]